MLFNYFKIALRSLLKFKGYAAVNLLGLSLGLSAGILIMLYVIDETSFDTFHAQGDRIYRVESSFHAAGAANAKPMETNGWPVGYLLKKDYPEVESVIYARGASFMLVNYQDKRVKQNSYFASEDFFKLFSFPLLKGNAAKALADPYTVVITEDMEKKFFNGDALNKNLIVSDTLQFLVTGVTANVPANSHIQFDMLFSFATYAKLDRNFSYDNGWGNINMHNYILVKEGTDEKALQAKVSNLYSQHAAAMLKEWGSEAQVKLRPLSGVYLHASSNEFGPVGSMDRVYLVAGIGVFVILLACINFINLTTARSVYRAKEVGLRKVVGSTRGILMRQFLSESFVLTTIALFLGITLTSLVLPFFNVLLHKDYGFHSLFSPAVLLGIALLLVIVTLLSGYYPALVLSGMRPAEVLKGKLQTSTRGVQLRRSLVVFQFVISVGLVLGTFIVIRQLTFMQQQQLGFAKDEIFVVNASRARSENPDAYETLKNELKALSMVEDVSFTNAVPGTLGWNGQIAYPEGQQGESSISVEYIAVDDRYISTMGLDVIAGETFQKDHAIDLEDGLVLNEAAVADFGWSSPAEAIGKKIASPSSYPAGKVIGVVKNYHHTGLQQAVGPIVMDYNPQASYLYAVRYKAADTQSLISSLDAIWKKHFPGYDFNYFFLDQNFERQYLSEQRLANVFGLFSVVTIVIALIGLLGLVSFMVVSRTKEIGVRKVLGADVLSITTLLSREFIILVLIANVIAAPLAWYGASQWLQNFATRVPISPLMFVLTLLVVVAVTLITISFQTIRAASTNPVNSLRSE
jgi:putative ABC transport system permease protein